MQQPSHENSERVVCISGGRFRRRGYRTRARAPEEGSQGGGHHSKIQDPGLERDQEFQGLLLRLKKLVPVSWFQMWKITVVVVISV